MLERSGVRTPLLIATLAVTAGGMLLEGQGYTGLSALAWWVAVCLVIITFRDPNDREANP